MSENKKRLETALAVCKQVMAHYKIDAFIVAAGVPSEGSKELEALVHGDATIPQMKQFATHIQVGITAAEKDAQQKAEAAKARRN